MGRIGFGIIGCGRIAPKHAEAIIALEEAELVAVCDIDANRVRDFETKYRAKGYDDYEQLLANPDVQVVNICTPSGLHAEIGIAAARAGKHVMVEKPMAMNLKEANALVKACEEAGVLLAVVHQNRFNSAVKQLRGAVEEGRFGRLTHGSAVIRWNRNDNYYAQAPWRGTWSQDGGCLMNQSIHNIDLLQWMMGPVESVFAYTATHLRKIEAEDNAVAVLRFKHGALGVIEAANTIYPTNLEETLNIFGETGTVVLGGIAVNKIEVWRFGEEGEEAAVLARQQQDPPNVYGFGHKDIIQDMIQAVKSGGKPAIDGYEGRKALEIVLAIYKSAYTGRPVTLPVEEDFNLAEVFSFDK
ncbi:MAG: Gfo/Idh/MocA family oxidoreductase [Clostridia bacterium]|nr:Gfo/Idh/MocA family oxidoreductase [Clostridia bacterium]